MDVWAKSETVDPEIRAYVYSLVNAVGGQDTVEDRYAIGDDALAVLKDLRRWLKLYDDKTNRFDVKRCLAEANLVRGDLLEILALWTEDAQDNKVKGKLALACLELLVPLTWPIELEADKSTVNHVRHTPYLQLAQVGYKRNILHYDAAHILRTVIRIALPSMAQERRERSRRDEGIIKLALYFLRNVAMIAQPQNLPSQGEENEIGRSATIDAFHDQDAFNLLLTVGSGVSDEYQEQDVIVLETLFHLLKGVDPKKLFMEKEQLATEETNELRDLLQKEKAMHNSYNKHAPTRHNRFGTMIWVKRDDDKMSTVPGQNSITNIDGTTTLRRMDSSKKYNKPKTRGRLTEDFSGTSDFGGRVELDDRARKHLRSFVEDFLDSSFNPLFSCLRKAIEREVARVQTFHHKQYCYLISWFLAAEAGRREQAHRQRSRHSNSSSNGSVEDNSFAYVAAVLDQETFVLLSRQMQKASDDKSWHDLQAAILAFTQILLTVQNMEASKDEEDQEIAENIQQRIFYEEATHDLLLSTLRGYKAQGFAYLDTVTECVHVFSRMLERYAKQNVDLQIRSKRRARRKKKEKLPETNGEDNDAEDAAEDEREAHMTVSERKFDFARFSAKVFAQPNVDTFVCFLQFYADLTAVQLKRCHRFFYRLAFKQELPVLIFRVDILALLHQIIKGPRGLDSAAEGFKDWETLVQQIFRKCIKWIERETEGEGWKEAAVTEMLFSKLGPTLFYLQNGFERVVEKKTPRPPAELEVKRAVKEEERIGVVVSVMLELGNGDAIEWAKKQLKEAAEARQAWADERVGRTEMEGPVAEEADAQEQQSVPIAPTIFLVPDNDERKQALFRDKFLRLLLTTIGCERLGSVEDVDASWILPSELTAEKLKEALGQIQKTEFDPPNFEEGKTAMDLIRAKSAYSRREAAFDSAEESGSDREIGDAQFPENLRKKRAASVDSDGEPTNHKKRRLTRRNRGELTEEQAQARAEEKRKKEKERNAKIKSQLYVTASDDESDEERDAEFFRLEEERRRRMAGLIKKTLREEDSKDVNAAGRGVNGISGLSEDESEPEIGTERPLFSESEDEADSPPAANSEDDAEGSDDDNVVASSLEQSHKSVDDTPLTSMPVEPLPLSELSPNVASGKQALSEDVAMQDRGQDDSEDEDDAPIVKTGVRRRNLRAGFIVDSDE